MFKCDFEQGFFLQKCAIGLDQILRELFKSCQYLHYTKIRLAQLQLSVLNVPTVLNESGWTV